MNGMIKMLVDYKKDGAVNTIKNYSSNFKITPYGVAINKNGRYVLPKQGYTALARAVYQEENSSIPDGYEIHHIDGDRSNDNADNLIALSHEDHVRVHMATANKAVKIIRGVINEK